MNLPDLIKRTDRAVQLAAGTAVQGARKWENALRRVVILAPASQLNLLRADEFECLRTFPKDISWRVWGSDESARQSNGGGATFAVEATNPNDPEHTSVLFHTELSSRDATTVLLSWPSWVTDGANFHLRLTSGVSSSVVVDAGARYESRSKILHLIKGNGVEIGPGLNPHVLPSPNVSVRYVESASAEEWIRNYKKTDIPSIAEQRNLWSQYIVGDAQMLSTIPDCSLDFIYSSHVFEHLMNPLGVLENWHRKLTPSGMILGVVPDCRYIFDLRQPPSTEQDWLKQRASSTWKVGRQQYERWCRFTAPYHTPEDLIARNYSIHVHFYTPESFAKLCRLVALQGLFKAVHLETAPNHRDFGFVLSRA